MAKWPTGAKAEYKTLASWAPSVWGPQSPQAHATALVLALQCLAQSAACGMHVQSCTLSLEADVVGMHAHMQLRTMSGRLFTGF